MKKVVLTLSLALLAFASVYAGDGGSILGVGVITGDDGNKYIYVKNSSGGATFGAGANQLNDEIYIPWDKDDPAFAASQVAILKDALKDPSLHIHVTKGSATDKIISGVWKVVGYQFSIRK